MEKQTYGCKLSPIDLRDYKIKASAINLPDEFELKFDHYIKNQGQVGSCVAHATSEILQYYSKEVMSTNFIYSTRKELYGDTGTGMCLFDACRTVKNYGDMLERDCPGNIEAPKCFEKAAEMLADEEKLARAYTYRIDSYFKCNSINEIKSALMNYGPVLVAFKWYHKYSIKNNILYFDTTSDFGHHALMLYGWTKDGWLIQNSWGRSFGKNGCVVIPYENKVEEARGLIDHDNSQDTDIVIPNKNGYKIIDALYKAVNTIVNLILKR